MDACPPPVSRGRRRTRRVLAIVASVLFLVAGGVPASATKATTSSSTTTTTYHSFSGLTASCAQVGGSIVLHTDPSPCGSYPRTATSLDAAQATASQDAVGDFSVTGDAFTISPFGASAQSFVWTGVTFATTSPKQSLAITVTWKVTSSAITFFPAQTKLNFVQHVALPFAGRADGSNVCTSGSPVTSGGSGIDFSAPGPGVYTDRWSLTCPGGAIAPGTWMAGVWMRYLAEANLGEVTYSLTGQVLPITVTTTS